MFDQESVSRIDIGSSINLCYQFSIHSVSGGKSLIGSHTVLFCYTLCPVIARRDSINWLVSRSYAFSTVGRGRWPARNHGRWLAAVSPRSNRSCGQTISICLVAAVWRFETRQFRPKSGHIRNTQPYPISTTPMPSCDSGHPPPRNIFMLGSRGPKCVMPRTNQRPTDEPNDEPTDDETETMIDEPTTTDETQRDRPVTDSVNRTEVQEGDLIDVFIPAFVRNETDINTKWLLNARVTRVTRGTHVRNRETDEYEYSPETAADFSFQCDGWKGTVYCDRADWKLSVTPPTGEYVADCSTAGVYVSPIDETDDEPESRWPTADRVLEPGTLVWTDAAAWYDEPDRSGQKGAEVVDDCGETVRLHCEHTGDRELARENVYTTNLSAGDRVSFNYDSNYSDERQEKSGKVVEIKSGRMVFQGAIVETDGGKRYEISLGGCVKTRGETRRRIGSDARITRDDETDDETEPEVMADGGIDIARPDLQDTSTNARVVVSVDESRDFSGQYLEMETQSGHTYTFKRLSDGENYTLETATKPNGEPFGDSYGSDLPANVAAILAEHNDDGPDTAERKETEVRLRNLLASIDDAVNSALADDDETDETDETTLRDTLERITERNAETYQRRLETGEYGLSTDDAAERKEKARVTLDAMARRRVRKLRESPYWVESEYDEIADGDPARLVDSVDPDTATA